MQNTHITLGIAQHIQEIWLHEYLQEEQYPAGEGHQIDAPS